jgi:hypothetical protein
MDSIVLERHAVCTSTAVSRAHFISFRATEGGSELPSRPQSLA